MAAVLAAVGIVMPWGLGGVRSSLARGVDSNLAPPWSRFVVADCIEGHEAQVFADLNAEES